MVISMYYNVIVMDITMVQSHICNVRQSADISMNIRQHFYPNILNYELRQDKNKKNNIFVDLKYNQGNPVIKEITRISKPGRRVYTKADSIPKIQNGLGIAIMSTSKGVMTDSDARKQNIGGEILCRVF